MSRDRDVLDKTVDRGVDPLECLVERGVAAPQLEAEDRRRLAPEQLPLGGMTEPGPELLDDAFDIPVRDGDGHHLGAHGPYLAVDDDTLVDDEKFQVSHCRLLLVVRQSRLRESLEVKLQYHIFQNL